MTGPTSRAGLVAGVMLVTGILVLRASAQEPKLGDVGDGNRSIPVHLINLLDEEGTTIRPADDPLMPFSIRETCSGDDCHDYRTISSGWHFNAADPDVPPGRRGQPWILLDQQTATQIPLSYRSWPGTYRPEQVGLTPWEFVQAFGRHLPGGGIGEDEEAQSIEFFQRWMVSGQIEANCLSCHDAEPFHDQAEYATQIARQNFRWAAAASSGFAHVSGSARKMPDTYDIYFGAVLDDPSLIPPSVSYDESRFNTKDKVFFDIKRDIPPERCYFCHSTKVLDKANPDRWTLDKDVHLAAGMTCVDCHRNGLDHAIIRGYEGEAQTSANPSAAELTCSGCHLGEASGAVPRAGRLGAPRPRHAGIPTLHFDKLTCTACHSGPWAAPETRRVKTSRAHALGTAGVNKSDGILPHIMAPVFARQADDMIAPHKLFWPAFWARLKGESVSPMAPEAVRRVAGGILTRDQLSPAGDWLTLTGEQVAGVLELLSAQQSDEGVPVYVSGGKLYRRADAGKLTAEEHPAARPYSWAFAHDVRPAAQSLGVRGCRDCHATDAPFLLGEVEVDAPFSVGPDSVKTMTAFLGLGSVYPRIFAFSFVFRPWMKAVTLLSALVMAAILSLYACQGLARISKAAAGEYEGTGKE